MVAPADEQASELLEERVVELLPIRRRLFQEWVDDEQTLRDRRYKLSRASIGRATSPTAAASPRRFRFILKNSSISFFVRCFLSLRRRYPATASAAPGMVPLTDSRKSMSSSSSRWAICSEEASIIAVAL